MNYVKYFILRVKQLGQKNALNPDEMKALVEEAERLALVKVWNAGHWTFRNRQYTLDTSTAADRYQLPDYCAVVGVPRQESSNSGGALNYLSKAAFDRKFPKLSAYADGYPQVWTVYEDEPNHAKYIQFYPRPSIDEVYLNILTTTPDSTDHIPEEATGAMLAAMGKYLYSPNSDEYRAAVYDLKNELRALSLIDTPQGEIPHKMFDDTDQQLIVGYPWA